MKKDRLSYCAMFFALPALSAGGRKLFRSLLGARLSLEVQKLADALERSLASSRWRLRRPEK